MLECEINYNKLATDSAQCLINRVIRNRPAPAPLRRILLLPGRRNILFFRSEAGRTNGWAQAHFFVARGYSASWTGIGRGVFAWIWKKSARLPSGWRVRKAWKSPTSNGKLENNASFGCI